LPNPYTYKTLAGDTFDMIALDFYNDESLASVIIQANYQYRDTIIFSGGEVLTIPIIETPSANSLPPWKRGAS